MGKKGTTPTGTPRAEFTAEEQRARQRLTVTDMDANEKQTLKQEIERLGRKAAGAVHYSVEVDAHGNAGKAVYNQTGDGFHSECVICSDKVSDCVRRGQQPAGQWTILNSLPPCNGCYKNMVKWLVACPNLQIEVKCDITKGDGSTHKYALGNA